MRPPVPTPWFPESGRAGALCWLLGHDWFYRWSNLHIPDLVRLVRHCGRCGRDERFLFWPDGRGRWTV